MIVTFVFKILCKGGHCKFWISSTEGFLKLASNTLDCGEKIILEIILKTLYNTFWEVVNWLKLCMLTPRRPRCVFWQHNFWRQVCVTKDFHVFSPNFNKGCGQGLSFMSTKFPRHLEIWVKSYGLICSLFLNSGNLGTFEFIFFQKQKFEIGFLDLYIHGKLLIIPFWSMSQKLRGVLVCRQL